MKCSQYILFYTVTGNLVLKDQIDAKDWGWVGTSTEYAVVSFSENQARTYFQSLSSTSLSKTHDGDLTTVVGICKRRKKAFGLHLKDWAWQEVGGASDLRAWVIAAWI